MRFLTYSAILLMQLWLTLSPANAALRFEDRKPINSGMWFDPSRSGEGFELRAVRDEVFIVWFAYNDEGKPVWYTAQGPLNINAQNRYSLQEHRFENGQARASIAGELTLISVASTQIALKFSLGPSSGTRKLQQLEPSTNAAESNHSGQWYQPSNSGYGLGLSESEQAGVAVIYAYDASGASTWLFGGRSAVKTADYPMFYYTGSCPSCSYRAPVVRPAGSLKLEFPSADSLIASLQSADIGSDFQIARAALTRLTQSADALAANRALVAAPDAVSLQRALIEASKTQFPVNGIENSGVGFSPTPTWHPTTVPFLTPNLIKQNVDEAISLRADGDEVYAISPQQTELRVLRYQSGQLAVQRELPLRKPIALPLVRGQTLATPIIGSALNGLMLYGDEIIVTRGSLAPRFYAGPASFLPPPSTFANARIYLEFIKKTGASPSRSLEIEGILLASRRIENTLYILSRSTIDPTASVVNASDAQRTAMLPLMPLENFLPSIWINGEKRSALSAPSVYSPPVGVPTGNQYIVLTQINLDRPLEDSGTINSVAMIGQLSGFYFSEQNLTIATNRFFLGANAFQDMQNLQRPFSTELHRFKLELSGAAYVGTGAVDGILDFKSELAGQRLGDRQNELNVVTTFNRGAHLTGQNRLSILAPSAIAANLLKTIATLPNARRPTAFGKPGEAFFGTRFIGDKLYAVPYSQNDSMFIVDLQDSSNPVISAEIPAPSFSSILYPLGNNFLLSVGNNAPPSESGSLNGGLMLSVFDTTNAARPVGVSTITLGTAGSNTALFNSHLALATSSASNTQTQLTIPAVIYSSDSEGDFSGLIQLDINRGARPSVILKAPFKASIPVPGPSLTVALKASYNSARSINLRDLRIYQENGRIWYQRGDQVFGPL